MCEFHDLCFCALGFLFSLPSYAIVAKAATPGAEEVSCCFTVIGQTEHHKQTEQNTISSSWKKVIFTAFYQDGGDTTSYWEGGKFQTLKGQPIGPGGLALEEVNPEISGGHVGEALCQRRNQWCVREWCSGEGSASLQACRHC